MAHYGKFIAGALGWTLAGPIGGLVGFFLGSFLDNEADQPHRQTKSNQQTRQGDFHVSLLLLTAAVMQANGKIKRSELDYVKQFLIAQFGAHQAKELLGLLKGFVKQSIPLDDVTGQIATHMSRSMRLQLMQYLFGIARADGTVDQNELKLLQRIANGLRIPAAEFNSLKAMFYADKTDYYKVLNVNKSSTDDEIKKAYRKLAVEYHPDKVASLGDDIQRGAKEKFQKIQKAYEEIKKERGIK